MLTRQGSLYSLTLDEVQHQLGDLGKPLCNMNLDELLKSVWSAEANQVDSGAAQHGNVYSQHRQSSLTLSRDLSKKTVDEVWQDIIQQGQKKKKKKNNNDDQRAQERQPTLGEMTLEDFLVKAGVVAESSSTIKELGHVLIGSSDQIKLPQQQSIQQPQWTKYQLPSVHQMPQQQQPQSMLAVLMPPGHHPVPQPLPIASANPIIDGGYPETQMIMMPSSLMGSLSETQTLGRKRVAPGDVIEKTVEKRQKRMIKNRESAARSRARKQAYTHELENKVSRLEEENDRLKRQKVLDLLSHDPGQLALCLIIPSLAGAIC
ncbi:hypothetical protein NMG60_11001120 [Bertholletia excelsa]